METVSHSLVNHREQTLNSVNMLPNSDTILVVGNKYQMIFLFRMCSANTCQSKSEKVRLWGRNHFRKVIHAE